MGSPAYTIRKFRELQEQITALAGASVAEAWDEEATYAEDDVVLSGGKFWQALQESTNVTPEEGADWTEVSGGWLPPEGWSDSGVMLYDGETARVILDGAGPTIGLTAFPGSSDVLTVFQDGETQNRWTMDSDGRMEWGDGTNPADVWLERTAGGLSLASVSEGSLTEFYPGSLNLTAAYATDALLRSFVSDGALSDLFRLYASGRMEWGDGTNPADTWFDRGAGLHIVNGDYITDVEPGTLRTTGESSDDPVIAARVAANAQAGFELLASGRMEWGNGTDAADTFLERISSGNGLSVDGQIVFDKRTDPEWYVLATYLGGDENHFLLRADGRMEWGNGTDPADLIAERSGPGIFKLSHDDGEFHFNARYGRARFIDNTGVDASAAIEVTRSLDAALLESWGPTSDETPFRVLGSGRMEWGNGTDPADAFLERNADGRVSLTAGSSLLEVGPVTGIYGENGLALDGDSAGVTINSDMRVAQAKSLILLSPDLTEYKLVVANGGALSTVAV